MLVNTKQIAFTLLKLSVIPIQLFKCLCVQKLIIVYTDKKCHKIMCN